MGHGQRRGTQAHHPKWGLGAAPVTPLPSWLPRGPTGTARIDQADGRRMLCFPEAPEGPSFPKPRQPRAGGLAEQRGSRGHPQSEHHLCATSSQSNTGRQVRGQGSGRAGQTRPGSGTLFSGRGSREEGRWGRERGRGGGGGGGQREARAPGAPEPAPRPQALAPPAGPSRHPPAPGPHVAHLSDDGLLLLTEVLLTAVLQWPVEVFMHLQDLKGRSRDHQAGPGHCPPPPPDLPQASAPPAATQHPQTPPPQCSRQPGHPLGLPALLLSSPEAQRGQMWGPRSESGRAAGTEVRAPRGSGSCQGRVLTFIACTTASGFCPTEL